MSAPVIYTIGHSNHTADLFLELLKAFRINCLIDVRSTAASAYNPHFNKEPLSNFLKNNNITYLHFADEFGARHTDPDLLDEDDKVDFEKVRKSASFQKGLERLKAGLDKGFTITLMCSESEPFDCHRFSMISLALVKNGFTVKHILKDKTLLSNEDLEKQLLKKYDAKLPKPDMFNPHVTREEQLDAAYKFRNKDIAFSPYDKQSVADHD